MSELLSVLLTLHVGVLSTPPGPKAIPFRAEVRRAAAEVALRGPRPLSSVGPGIVGPGIVAAGVGGVATGGAAPALDPSRAPSLHVDDWIGLLASRLDSGRSGIVHAAAWLATAPVRLDVGPDHVGMHFTVHTR